MIKDIILQETWSDEGNPSYEVIEDATNRGIDCVSVERRDPCIFIFDFTHDDGVEARFTVAVYTLDEALHTFVNMYKDVDKFAVTIKS